MNELLSDRDDSTGVVTLTLNRPERMNALTFEVVRRAAPDHPLAQRRRRRSRDRAHRCGSGLLLGRGCPRHHRRARWPRLPRTARVHAHDVRPRAGDAAVPAPDRRGAQRHGRRRRRGHRRRGGCPHRRIRCARIAFLFTRVGLAGADMGAAWLLPRIVGLGRATELLMTGEFITADDACRIGLYNQVVEPGALREAARARAETLARGPSFALEITKDALNREAHMDLGSALDLRSADPGVADDAPGFSRGLRSVSREAAGEVPVSAPVRMTAAAATAAAFLDDAHVRCAADITRWSREHLLDRAEPPTDAAARLEARALLGRAWIGGWLAAIGRQDLRALCLVRDAVAAASPLADAVLALQALGGTPIVLAGSDEQRARWLPGRSSTGRTMTAFAMTEPEAGSDVAAMQTTARSGRQRLGHRRRETPHLQRRPGRPLCRVRGDLARARAAAASPPSSFRRTHRASRSPVRR